jgi:dTDP-4-dehydrorhamnose reductase
MKILVIGKDGQLGKSIKKISTKSGKSKNFIFVGRQELNLNNTSKILDYFKDKNFDTIVNCAAYTNVDKAEEEIELSNQINNIAVTELAKIAFAKKIRLIHISTDYVFDGKNHSLYREIDNTNPLNVYGKTKLDGEKAIKKFMPVNGTIIRTSWLYSHYGNNFVQTILQQGLSKKEVFVVNDQIGSPTFANDLAIVILKIINQKNYIVYDDPTNLYHFSNTGDISWYTFTKEIFKIKNINCKVKPVSSLEYPTLAKRPKNSSMDSNKIREKFNLKQSSWNDSLRKYLTSL